MKVVYIYYYRHSEERMNAEVFERLFQQLPHFVQQQVLGYKNWQDRQRIVIGKNLLMTALHSLNSNLFSISNLKYTKFQRPYIDNAPDFNIAHSGNFALCALSKTTRVGVDIEKIGKAEIDLFESHFSQKELAQITEAENSNYAFYKLWTQKEACLKAVGMGLSLPLNKIVIDNNKVFLSGQEWHLHLINLHPEYLCYLCTSTSLPEIIIKEVNF